MNKIELLGDGSLKTHVNHNIIINDYNRLESINKDILFIVIPENIETELELLLNDDSKKICIMLSKNSKLTLFQLKELGNNYKYDFILEESSQLIINKFYNISDINEIININLKGKNSKINYNFSTITFCNQKYIININHNNKNTKSDVNCYGVSYNNSILEFEINSVVKKGMENSVLNQEHKIITMGDNKSIIKPNLYIDEYLVEAKHGALIGDFDKEELFYLQSRGLSLNCCYNLLIKGFILGILDINEIQRKYIINILEKYEE